MKKKLFDIFKNESGSSILYVLAVMLMLVIIGTSVLTAAVANVGFSTRQREHTRGVMLADAIHRNLLYSLQHASIEAEEEYLGTQIPNAVMALYMGSADQQNPETLLPLHLELTLEDLASNEIVDINNKYVKINDITLSLPVQQVDFYEPLLSFDDNESPVAAAHIYLEMQVDVSIAIYGSTMETVAVYQFYGTYYDENATAEDGFNMILQESDDAAWEWRLVRYEKIAS